MYLDPEAASAGEAAPHRHRAPRVPPFSPAPSAAPRRKSPLPLSNESRSCGASPPFPPPPLFSPAVQPSTSQLPPWWDSAAPSSPPSRAGLRALGRGLHAAVLLSSRSPGAARPRRQECGALAGRRWRGCGHRGARAAMARRGLVTAAGRRTWGHHGDAWQSTVSCRPAGCGRAEGQHHALSPVAGGSTDSLRGDVVARSVSLPGWDALRDRPVAQGHPAL